MISRASDPWSYVGYAGEFVEKALRRPHNLVEPLSNVYKFDHGRPPDESTVSSWYCSLKGLATLLNASQVNGQQVVVLEAIVGSCQKRIDAVICGKNSLHMDTAYLIECKGRLWDQVTRVKKTEPGKLQGRNPDDTLISDEDGNNPCAQSRQYRLILQEAKSMLNNWMWLNLHSRAFLHEYKVPLNENWRTNLQDNRVCWGLLWDTPLFTQADQQTFSRDLQGRISRSNGDSAAQKFRSLCIASHKVTPTKISEIESRFSMHRVLLYQLLGMH